MAWLINKEIPLSEELQLAVSGVLVTAAGTSLENPGEDEELVGYARFDELSKARKKLGTACGDKGNLFSDEMMVLLEMSKHILMCWYVTEENRIEICSLAVNGFGFAQAEEMERLADLAGCSLRPDVANILGEQWVIFESE